MTIVTLRFGKSVEPFSHFFRTTLISRSGFHPVARHNLITTPEDGCLFPRKISEAADRDIPARTANSVTVHRRAATILHSHSVSTL